MELEGLDTRRQSRVERSMVWRGVWRVEGLTVTRRGATRVATGARAATSAATGALAVAEPAADAPRRRRAAAAPRAVAGVVVVRRGRRHRDGAPAALGAAAKVGGAEPLAELRELVGEVVALRPRAAQRVVRRHQRRLRTDQLVLEQLLAHGRLGRLRLRDRDGLPEDLALLLDAALLVRLTRRRRHQRAVVRARRGRRLRGRRAGRPGAATRPSLLKRGGGGRSRLALLRRWRPGVELHASRGALLAGVHTPRWAGGCGCGRRAAPSAAEVGVPLVLLLLDGVLQLCHGRWCGYRQDHELVRWWLRHQGGSAVRPLRIQFS